MRAVSRVKRFKVNDVRINGFYGCGILGLKDLRVKRF